MRLENCFINLNLIIIAKCALPVTPWGTGGFLADCEDVPRGSAKVTLKRNKSKGTASATLEHENRKHPNGRYRRIIVDATLLGNEQNGEFFVPDQITCGVTDHELVL